MVRLAGWPHCGVHVAGKLMAASQLETYRSCHLQSIQSIRGLRYISSLSLHRVSAHRITKTSPTLKCEPAADTENSRLSAKTGRCQRWHTKGEGLRTAEEVNWRTPRATEKRAAISLQCCVGGRKELCKMRLVSLELEL